MLKPIAKLFKVMSFFAGSVILVVMGIGIAHNLDDGHALLIAFSVLVLAVLIAFVKMFVKKETKKEAANFSNQKAISKEKKPDGDNNKILLGALAIVLIFLAFLYGQSRALDQQKKLSEKSSGKVEGIDTQVSITPTVTSTPTTKPVQKTAVKPTLIPTIDPNPIVSCKIHASCGGGSIQMRKNECDNSICCEVGGTWRIYPSKSECNQAQEQYWKDYYANKTYDSPTKVYVPVIVPQNPVVSSTPIPVPTAKVDNTAANSQCKGAVRDWLQEAQLSLQRTARANGTLDSSWFEGESTKLENQARNALNQCDALYPIN
jgi:hypothetical protein